MLTKDADGIVGQLERPKADLIQHLVNDPSMLELHRPDVGAHHEAREGWQHDQNQQEPALWVASSSLVRMRRDSQSEERVALRLKASSIVRRIRGDPSQ